MFNRVSRLFIAALLVSVILTACGTAPKNSTASARLLKAASKPIILSTVEDHCSAVLFCERVKSSMCMSWIFSVISAGFAVLVPAGTNHNITNTGSVPLKLYTLYAPPNHRDGVVHHARAEAEKDTERFDGKTSE
jgi:hypothetical protein